MNRLILMILAGILMLVALQACVQEDFFGKSSEKKILEFQLEGQVGNSRIDQDIKRIEVVIGADAEITSLKPSTLITSTFAAVSPDAGVALDFSDSVIYVVKAEDGSTAEYTVIVTQEGAEPQLENAGFDEWYTTPKGYQEPGRDINSIWSTGNGGTITFGTPNVVLLQISGQNYAAKLTTLDLGNLAGLVGQRMAAGTLFTGKFELDIANPLNSVKFGIPYSARPQQFTFTYAYSPGSPYLNRTGQTLNKQDSCDIYVLLENRESADIKRVATGWFRSGLERADKWYTETVTLVYGQLGSNVPDYQKPLNGIYANPGEKVTHITVVFSSSSNGGLFEGGVNSTLVIDEMALIY
jgi:hypothetical protein